MLQNVLSFSKKNLVFFQIALAVWQILKFTPLAALIEGLLGRLKSLALPCFFPAYKKLRHCPGCSFKTVKCVVLKGTSQSKTKPLTNPKNQVTMSIMSKDTNLISNGTSKPQAESSTGASKPQAESSTGSSKPQEKSVLVNYLGDPFEVKMEGDKVFVNGEMSYYITDRQWKNICKMEQKCFKKKDGKGSEKENEVVFVKRCRYIWPKTAIGEVMEFEEVLDNVIFENKKILISDDVWFLPMDSSKKSGGKLPKFLNLVGLFFNTHKKTSLPLANSFTIASAILEFCKPVRSRIYWIINKMFCRSVQYICNKLPYWVRRCVYLSIWVKNLMPRNDILLKVGRRDYLNVVISGTAKTNSAQEATEVDWLDKKEEEEEYEFRCGCSIVMKAKYEKATGECKATMQHTSAVFPISISEKRVFVNCKSLEEFRRIGTFLSCLATSKAGSLLQYDRNDNEVHVRSWRASVRDYEDAGFPKIKKLRLHDVIV